MGIHHAMDVLGADPDAGPVRRNLCDRVPKAPIHLNLSTNHILPPIALKRRLRAGANPRFRRNENPPPPEPRVDDPAEENRNVGQEDPALEVPGGFTTEL